MKTHTKSRRLWHFSGSSEDSEDHAKSWGLLHFVRVCTALLYLLIQIVWHMALWSFDINNKQSQPYVLVHKGLNNDAKEWGFEQRISRKKEKQEFTLIILMSFR